MHTRTHLKAALHQLSLAKVEMRDMGHHAYSEQIADAEVALVTLIREFYTLNQTVSREIV